MRSGIRLRHALGFGSGRRRAAAVVCPSVRVVPQEDGGPARRWSSERDAVGERVVELLPITYWCSAIAYPQGAGRSVLFGVHIARDARRAVRWMQMRVGQLADQFDLKHSQSVRVWADDLDAAAAAMDALLAGESYSLTLHDDRATYIFTAQVSTGDEPILPGRGVTWPI
ncbi:hypothetical protein [Kitasatospora sp. NE20-6]|uniref:hypothetical protein n=1 Tax=Kitasatospora sp. NE20-6 TaxID=2859066 RepID=UPI0038B350B0